MARFEPFPGIRYDLDRSTSAGSPRPPYDVIDAAERAALAGPRPRTTPSASTCPSRRRRPAATRPLGRPRCAEWRADGMLVADDAPVLHRLPDASTDDAGAGAAPPA